MKEVAKNYLLTLEEAAKAPDEKLAEYEARLSSGLGPYASDPAFQAFLELKKEGKIGQRLDDLKGNDNPSSREN